MINPKQKKLFLPANINELLFIDNNLFRCICLYFQLKYLYKNSTIFNDKNKKPHKKIALFLECSESSLRAKLKFLENKKIIRYDYKRNLILCPLRNLEKILKFKFSKRKYCFENKYYVQDLVRYIAISENYKKQNYILLLKILAKEKNINFKPTKSKGCESDNFYNAYNSTILRRLKKHIKKNYDNYLKKYQEIFEIEFQQVAYSFPGINPQITLSQKGIARLFNRRSSSAGYYNSIKLQNLGLIEVYKNVKRIDNNSPAVYEYFTGIRNDVFEYKFKKSYSNNLERNYYINGKNQITLTGVQG